MQCSVRSLLLFKKKSKVSDSSTKSAAQAVESDGSNEREVGNEHH